MEDNENDLNNQDQNQNNQYQNSNQQQDNYYSQQNYGNNFNDPYGYNNYNNQNYYNQQNYGPQGGYNFNGQPYTPTSKTGLGIVCALFLDLIGLIVGLTSYKEGTLERKTFMKAWIITYCIKTGISVIIGFVIGFCFPDLVLSYLEYV